MAALRVLAGRIMVSAVAAGDGHSLRGLLAGESFLIAAEPTDVTAQSPSDRDVSARRSMRTSDSD